MSKEWVVRIKHNETDDRWTYSIDGVKPEDMFYPQHPNGIDEWGHENLGPWNENHGGYLGELGSMIADEIAELYQEGDSFTYGESTCPMCGTPISRCMC